MKSKFYSAKYLPRLASNVAISLGLAIAGLSPLASHAATLTYDANTTPPANDGAGVWDTTTTNWFDGANDVAWPNTTDDTAIFGAGSGAAGIVTVSTVNANSIIFNAPGSGTYTLTGGTITLGGATPTITANVNGVISSLVAGTAGLTKNGVGILTLNGANTDLSGGIALTQGTLALGNSSAAGSSTITASTGTTISGTSGLAGNSVSAAIAVSGAGANVTLLNNNPSGGFNSVITGSSADQTLTISNAGGTSVKLNASSLKQLQGFSGTVSIAASNNLDFRGTTLNNGGDNALFVVNGGIGTRNGGFLALGALSGSGTIQPSFATSAPITFALTIGARNTDATFSGAINNASANAVVTSVIKTGTRIQVLSGSSHTYTGATTINGGTLQINGNISTSSGVTVNTGATLAAVNGTVSAITRNAGGLVSPGNASVANSISTLNGTGFTYNSPAALKAIQFDLSSTVGAPLAGTDNDLINLSAALTKGTGTTFVLGINGGVVGQTYTLMNYASTTFTAGSYASTGGAGEFQTDVSSDTGTFNVGATSLTFTVLTVVPEPSTWAMMLGGAGLMALRIRSRNKRQRAA